MAKTKKSTCKPSKERTTGAIFKNKIGDISFHSEPVPMNAPGRKVRKRAPDYITSEVVPGPKSITTKEKCSFTEKGKRLKIRSCDIGLQFVGPSTTGPSGLKEGAYLRVCTEWGKDPLMVPVKNHQDAMRKSKAICGCVAKGETSKKCAGKIAGISRPQFTRKAAAKAREKNDCLQWSSNGKRCLRRAKV